MMRVVATLAATGVILLVAAAAATGNITLGGVALGSQVQNVVKEFGAPGLVQTTDDGNEWRWYDANGLDVDLLTDRSLVVRQILIARPEPLQGKPSKLVQPREFPLLEQAANSANAFMKAAGEIPQREPEDTISAWHVGDGLVVLELRDERVRKILALDRSSAAQLGYVAGIPAARYRAPRLVDQYAVNYPKRAIERRAEGVVVVQVVVTSSGSVKDVHVIVSSGDPDIDAAETLSMRRSKFMPARCDDQPCDSVFLDREEYTLAP